jgi:hypothetical protein
MPGLGLGGRMYSFIDQPAALLGKGSRFVLWAMRGWGQAMQQGLCPPGALAPAFAKMGVLQALPHFHMAMALLASDGIAHDGLAGLHDPLILEEEAVLLGLWRDIEAGASERAQATLALLVDEGTAAPILRAMGLATALFREMGYAPTGLLNDVAKAARP